MKSLELANSILAEIASTAAELSRAEAAAEAEMKAIREKHEGVVGRLKETLEGLDSNLVKLMKKHRAEFFDNTDQVNLQNGILLHGEGWKVKIPRNAAKAIEAQGWEEALKRTVTVDRAVVEKWPVERLVVIGAEKKPVETFSYELKQDLAQRRGDAEIGDGNRG
ncbi:MAG: hypothetical protein CVU64_14185 [Deltaproteobacteria bacterium HGW-Deltaproteobacteria-21]|nr:MAG: hypothetical protein CVU64_14185 [Deltaproteobacteria bacterium HGW-Deltaproteobacteria-21]